MRPVVHHLPAFFFLLVPLAALAWIGSAELSRQTERADRALTNQAMSFLEAADRRLNADLRNRVAAVVPEITIGAEELVLVDQELAGSSRDLLGFVVLDGDANMIYPHVPPGEFSPLQLMEPSTSADIRAAEDLIAVGDLEGARLGLDKYLTDATGRRSRRTFGTLQRAHLRMASVCRKLNELDDARHHFGRASYYGTRYSAAIGLLADVGLAEVSLTAEQNASPVVELSQRIAHGEYYRSVGDDILSETLRYLTDLLPTGSAAQAEILTAIEADAVRRRGREFAREYSRLLGETVRRRLRAVQSEADVLEICLPAGRTDGGVATLLLLRRMTEVERTGSLTDFGEESWVGLRYDLDSLLEAALTTTDEEFLLAVEGPEGTPILPRNPAADPPDSTASVVRPRLRTVAGMTLIAEPADPETFFADRQRSVRNRTLLLVALCVAAGGGALFLLRSVARESEIVNLKMKLVSRVSHELKTPLALIKMYAETLSLGRVKGPEDTQRFSGIITDQADRLTAMIQRVLDFARRESGEARFNPEPVDVVDRITHLVDAYAPRASARGIDLHVTAPSAPETIAAVDPTAFDNAILNLIENAVKYTPDSATDPEVHLIVEPDSTTERVLIRVVDCGIGIPDDERDRVFTSFYRARNAAESPGAGLGLDLVRSFAEGHGGQVSAHARGDLPGTEIRLILPLDLGRSISASVQPGAQNPDPKAPDAP